MNDASDDFDGGGDATEMEIIPPTGSGALATAAMSAEIDRQIATAKAYPRADDKKMLAKLLPRVTLSVEIAEACVYSLPRGNKNIEGPSIRFAEILFQTWGNCRVAAEFVGVDRENGLVITKGTFFDLESNIVTQAIEPRRITGRNGRLFSPDLIAITAKASLSIAKRNAILGGISAGISREAYHAARQLSIGDVKNFDERRLLAFQRFSEKLGIDKPTIFKLLLIDDEGQMRPNHLPTLRGFYNAITQGEETVETLMRLRAGGAAQDFERVENPLRDDPRAAEQQPTGTKTEPEIEDPKPAAAEKQEPKPEPKPEQKPDVKTSPAQATETPNRQTTALSADDGSGLPKTDAEYRAFADAWISEAGTITGIDQRWKSEKKLRADCKVSTETLEHLDEVKSRRIDTIRKQ